MSTDTNTEQHPSDQPDLKFINPYNQYFAIVIPEGVVAYKGLSPGAKIVYGRLLRYAGRKGIAFPHIPTLAEEVGLGQSQTKEYVTELVEKKFVCRYRVFARGNVYKFYDHPCLHGTEIGEARANSSAFSIGRDAGQQSIGRDAGSSIGRDAGSVIEESQLRESIIPPTPLEISHEDEEDAEPTVSPSLKRSWKRPKPEKPHAKLDQLTRLRQNYASAAAPELALATSTAIAYPTEPPAGQAPPTAPLSALEWNLVVTSGPPVEHWTIRDRALEAAATDPEFIVALPKVLGICQKAFENRPAEDVDWLNFRWLLRKKPGQSENWYRMASGEMNFLKHKPSNGAKADPFADLRKELGIA